MSLLLLTSLLLAFDQSSALTCRAVNFLKPEEVLAEIPNALDYLSASAVMDFSDDPTDRCSGAFVSDEGHILTAAHCLKTCREKAGTMQPPYDCKLKLNGRAVTVEILVAATCKAREVKLARFHSTMLGEARAKELLGDCVGQSDLAILKSKDPVSFACLPMNTSPPNLGDSVAALGRPMATERAKQSPGAKDADGKSLYYSTGKIIKSDSCTRVVNGTVMKNIVPNALEGLSHYLQTTVDLNYNSSGSPMLNQQGQIVGVAAFMFQDKKEECRGSTFFERLDGFDHQAEVSRSNLRAADLQCSKRRAGMEI